MNSFLKWIGGKRTLRKQIIALFPEEYGRYIEVFGGAGWVLFGKEPGKEMEVYNDANGELVNLYRVVKYHQEALQKELAYTLNSYEQFNICKNQLAVEGLTDIQRAARFYILIKHSYGANLKDYSGSERIPEKGIAYLEEISERLRKVVIENRDFERILKTYDRENALFYLDPPYHSVDFQYFVNVTFSLIRELQAQRLNFSVFIESRQDRNIIPVHHQFCKSRPIPLWGIIPFIQKNHPRQNV